MGNVTWTMPSKVFSIFEESYFFHYNHGEKNFFKRRLLYLSHVNSIFEEFILHCQGHVHVVHVIVSN